MALKTKSEYEKSIKNILENNRALFPNHLKKGSDQMIIPNLKPIEGDFFDHDWSQASVVFANSTCFSKFIMDEVFVKALSLPKGAVLINTSQKMPKKLMDKWQYITPFKRVMSWGIGKVFVYRKR